MNWGLRNSLAAVCCLVVLMPAPSVAGDAFRGQAIYNQYCSGCHGGDGVGVVAGTPSFRAPSQALMQPDASLQRTIERGRGIMPGFAGVLKPDQIYDVIAHLRTFF